jgi:uncharacterized protein YjbI with pentapeptide repeats
MKFKRLNSKKLKKHSNRLKRNGGDQNESNKIIANNNKIITKKQCNFEEDNKDITNCVVTDLTLVKNHNFIDVDFSRADLSNIKFKNVFFSNCKFNNTKLYNTDFTSCIFRGIQSISISGNPILPIGYQMWLGQIIGPYINYNHVIDMRNYYDLFINRFEFYNFNFMGMNFNNVDFTKYTWSSLKEVYQNFEGASFIGTNMTDINFISNNLRSVISGNIIGKPRYMPDGYSVINGYIVGPYVNLNNANLSGADLVDTHLIHTNLKGLISGNTIGAPVLPSGYKLIKGYIIGPDVNLTDVNLSGMDLTDMNLSYCVLKGVISGNITGTPKLPHGYKMIKGYILGPDVNLTDANLSGTDLSELVLNNCILKGIISGNIKGIPQLPKGYGMTKGYIVGPNLNLKGVDLTNSDLSSIDLTNSILDGLVSGSIKGLPILSENYKIMKGYIIGPYVNLNGADLNDVDLSNISLRGIKSGNIKGNPILPKEYHLIKKYIVGHDVDLRDANLSDLDLNGIDLSNSILNGIISGNIKGNPKLPNGYKIIKGYIVGPYVNLENADLSTSDLTDFKFKGIKSGNIKGKDLVLPDDYILRNGYIIGPYVDLSNADLTNQDLNKCDLTRVRSGNIKGQPKLPIGYKLINGYIIGPDVDLQNVDLSNMELIDINLNNADLSTCNLNQLITKGITGTPILPDNYTVRYGYIFGPGIDLSGVDLNGLDLSELNLTNVNLSRANLDKTQFASTIIFDISQEDKKQIKLYNDEFLGKYYQSDEIYNGFPIYKKESKSNNFIIRYQNERSTEYSRWQIIFEKDKTDRNYIDDTESGFAFSQTGIKSQLEYYKSAKWNIASLAFGRNINYIKLNVNLDYKNSCILNNVISKNITGIPVLPFNYKLIKSCIVGPGVRLKGIDFTNTDLSGINLYNCDLTNTDLNGAILKNIKSSNISGKPQNLPENYKIIKGYILGPDVDLSNADLRNLDLSNIKFNKSNLTNACFTGSDLTGTDLTQSNIQNIKSGNIKGTPLLPDGYKLVNGFIIGPNVDLQYDDLSYTEIYDINLYKLDLSTCILKGIKSRNIKGELILPFNYTLQRGYILGPYVDLSNVNLDNINLVGINLENAIFKSLKSSQILGKPILSKDYSLFNGYILGPNVDLRGANLQYGDLSNIDLNGALLDHVKSKDIVGIPILPKDYKMVNGFIMGPNVNLGGLTSNSLNLSGVNLIGANLSFSQIYNTDLSGANLTGADINNISSGNIIGEPILPIGYQIKNKMIIGPNVYIKGEDLEGVDLRDINLKGSTFNSIRGNPLLPTGYKTVFDSIVGPGMNLNNSYLINADLSNVDFSECNLSKTKLTGANLQNISSGNIVGIPDLSKDYNMVNQYIIGPYVNLTGAILKNAKIINANLTGVNLSHGVLTGSRLENTKLINVNLTATDLTYAALTNIISENIEGEPILPVGYHLINGKIFGNNINNTNADLDGVDLTSYNIKELNLGIIHGKPILPKEYKLINKLIIGPGLDLSMFDLSNFDLSNIDLTNSILSSNIKNIKSGNIIGKPTLPKGYNIKEGYIIGSGVNLVGAVLRGVDLSYQDFFGVNLDNADLTNANLSLVKSGNIKGYPILPIGYKLIDGTIIGPNLILNNLDLSGVDFYGVNLTNNVITDVNLTDALLMDSDLKGLKTMNITGEPKLPKGYKIVNRHIVGPGVDLSNVVLKNTNLKNMDLSDCNLTRTDLYNADLNGIITGNIKILNNFTPILSNEYKFVNGYIVGPGVILKNAKLNNINLKNINLDGAVLTDADLITANFTDFKSTGNIIGEPILSNQYKFIKGYIFGPHINLSNLDLTNFDLSNIDLHHADLSGSILKNVNLTGVNLNDSKLKNVISGNIIGTPLLSSGYTVTNGYITGPDTSYQIVNNIVIGEGVDLTNAILSNLDFSGFNFTNTNLKGTDLTNSLFNNESILITIADQIGPVFTEITNGTKYIKMTKNNKIYSNNNYTLNIINIKDFLRKSNDHYRMKIVSSLNRFKDYGDLWFYIEHSSNTFLIFQNIDKSLQLLLGNNFFYGFEIYFKPKAHRDNAFESTIYNNITVNLKSPAVLTGVISGNIIGNPVLPINYQLKNGYIIGPYVNLKGVDLTNFDLSGLDLSGIDLTSSILKNVKSGNIKGEPQLPNNYHLIGGYIIGPYVNLEGCKKLTNNSIQNKDLTGVNFNNADLNSIDFTGSILNNVNLNDANLNETNFKDTVLNNVTSKNITGVPKQLPPKYSIQSGYIIGPNITILLDDNQKTQIIKNLHGEKKENSLVDIFKMESFQFTYGHFKKIKEDLDKNQFKELQEFMKSDKLCSKNFMFQTNLNCSFKNGQIVNGTPETFKGGNKKHSIRKIQKRINSKKKLII